VTERGRGVVAVENNAARDWPHGRIKIMQDGETIMRLTPNAARRLMSFLDAAITKAERLE
jgi:hypothetical protein